MLKRLARQLGAACVGAAVAGTTWTAVGVCETRGGLQFKSFNPGLKERLVGVGSHRHRSAVAARARWIGALRKASECIRIDCEDTPTPVDLAKRRSTGVSVANALVWASNHHSIRPHFRD